MAARPYPVGPWPGGVNLIDPPKSLDPSELAFCLNWRLDPKGYPIKRPGHGRYGSSPAKVNGDNLINFLARYYNASIKELIAASNQKLYKGNDTTGAWTQINIDGSAAAILHASNLFSWLIYKNRMYACEGTYPIRYNGTDCVAAGHLIHNAASWTATPGVGGGLSVNSTYKYVMTNVQGDMGEGPIGAFKSITLTGTQNLVDLTNITDDPNHPRHETTAKKLYRTKANGSLYHFIATLGQGVTTYQDVTSDAQVGAELIITHAPRTDSRFCVLGHDERTYWFGRSGLNASAVEASDVGFPDRIIDNDSTFQVANNDGDVLNGGARVPSGIVFFKRKSMWLSRGYGTPLINISPTIGCAAPWAIVEVPGGIIFISQHRRVFFYDGSGYPEEIGRSISPELDNIPEASLNRAVACYHDNRYILAYDRIGASGYNSSILEYDYLGKKWDGPHTNANKLTPSYFSVWSSIKDSGQLFWGEARAASGGYVFQRTASTLDDDGVKPLARFRTGQKFHPEFVLARSVVFTKVLVTARFTAGGTLNISIVRDDGANRDTAVIPVPPASTTALVWGVDKWGLKPWGTGDAVLEQVLEGSFPIGARGAIPALEVEDVSTAFIAKLEDFIVMAELLPI